MKYTSSEANKLLKKLNQDYQNLLAIEQQSRSFVAATVEDVEAVRPEYDYAKMQNDIKAVCEKIRKVKHAINVFNTTAIVDGFDMTIDEFLVYLPQLNERAVTLNRMQRALPKAREQSYGSGPNATIDYRYINYDLDTVVRDYDEVCDLITKGQTALDYLNNTAEIEIGI